MAIFAGVEPMSYNLTVLQSNADGNLVTYFCLTNNLASSLPVYIILVVMFILVFTYLIRKGYTLYSILLVDTFSIAMMATIFMSFTCSTGRMIDPKLVLVFWLLVAIFAGLRKIVGD